MYSGAMIHRMFFKESHELGLTPATKRLLANRPAEDAPQPRFYESICAPAREVALDVCENRLKAYRSQKEAEEKIGGKD